MIGRLVASLVLMSLMLPPLVHAQADPSGAANAVLGGPSSVPGELQGAEEIQKKAYRRDERKRYLRPWYDWKNGLKERHGLSFGIQANLLYENASEVLGDEDKAAGGIYRLQGEWTLTGRDTGHPGSIVFRLENRSRIGSGIPPGSLRAEIGAAATDPGFAYSDNFGTDFSVLAWQQMIADKRAGFAVGLLDFSAYLDAFYFQTVSRGFLNRTFILSPTLATTGIGAFGAVGGGMVTDNAWIGGGFYDANAKSGDPGLDNWDSGELLKHLEVGWTPGFDRRSTDRLQLTYWHKDRLDDKGTPEGAGWLLSYSMKVRERWVPFVRAGWSDGGGGALAKRSVAAGFSYQMAFQDWLTFGVGWNKPSDKTHGEDLASEKALETSYLWQVTANTSFLADVQVILDPAQNPDKDSVWMGGMRLRLTF